MNKKETKIQQSIASLALSINEKVDSDFIFEAHQMITGATNYNQLQYAINLLKNSFKMSLKSIQAESSIRVIDKRITSIMKN